MLTQRQSDLDSNLEILIEWDKDLLIDAISELVKSDYIKSKEEFMKLVKQGEVQVQGERLELDDLDRVLWNEDVMRIGKKKLVKFIK